MANQIPRGTAPAWADLCHFGVGIEIRPLKFTRLEDATRWSVRRKQGPGHQTIRTTTRKLECYCRVSSLSEKNKSVSYELIRLYVQKLTDGNLGTDRLPKNTLISRLVPALKARIISARAAAPLVGGRQVGSRLGPFGEPGIRLTRTGCQVAVSK